MPSAPPAFYSPVPDAVHPAASAVDAHSADWAVGHGLCKPESRLTGIGVGTFVARCYPGARHTEHLETAADLVLLAFALDDAHLAPDATGLVPAACRLLAVLDAPEAPVTDPYEAALRDVVRRLGTSTTAANTAAIADGFRKSLLHNLWHVHNWRRGELPALNDYVTLRAGDVGGPWFSAFAPVCGAYELPSGAARDPRVRALTQAASLAAGVDNDLCSFSREDATGEKNLLHVLMRDHACSPARAHVLAVGLRNRLMLLYTRLRDAVSADGPALARYAHDLGHVVRGNLEWCHASARYRAPDPAGTPGAVPLPPLVVTGDPGGIDPAPLDLPATAWWWDRLPPAARG
ncbi:MAG TPA: hypothetical protein VFP69_06540 [Streptomyces sp.]|nr:hypothetical protein [Streptomyces sp.]